MVITADYKFMALVMGVPPNIWSRTWKCLWGRQHCGSEPQLEPGVITATFPELTDLADATTEFRHYSMRAADVAA